MKDSHWSVIENCLIYTCIDFVAFVEPTDELKLVSWQVRITKGDGSEDKSAITDYYCSLSSAVQDVERFFNMSILEQREQFKMRSKSS